MAITDRPTRHDRALALVLVSVLAALASVGCGGTAPATPSDAAPGAAGPTHLAEPVAGASRDALGAAPARVARPTAPVAVLDAPGGQVVTTLDPHTPLGSARALLVVGDEDGHLEVVLPVRPNGSTGYLRADGIEVRDVPLQVDVELAARELSVLAEGRVVLRSAIGIGAPGTPTPVGTFSVTDKVATDDPDGPYGPVALGLSAHSDVLTDFAGGDGQVGIHGTDDPASVGQAVSNGCIRVPHAVALDLDALLPLGTPVVVR